ncbi:hypothetical protein A2526_05405 [candidate division WOR-1 bacterium RIFOXYD2_FULL_36_8]|uniref:TonB C-terminal domain-containing protein n=1 Tax=candidate division WOR-1 bacterium RIFOXYB2_FULL_36_35 TaxID=1802578 RepID=A0A1F4S8R2_UNCSA|nr:MAG: hypothetical protein A2230_07340 [candidate division WOR-1 bacterium RIFOXYA2_FULL_36_21]OGC16799.1 MAG: hypothetical protein A2290_07940 [candidate division WOR-1 bacterium RIFOXYB2_FULL_36_35]OGC19814.1 MAG: hypothetical protein A2282_01090 [candidate division WOR-1 bacterium RIFOXYA12_FULL_36_13]OGC37305.1 MAG: hypothetical protein A2526_05405 [candidate division WOR-1 bacterium RIFOXYD2_FULL_36_8]
MIKVKEFVFASLSVLIVASFVFIFQGYKIKVKPSAFIYNSEIIVSNSQTKSFALSHAVVKPLVKNFTDDKTEIIKPTPSPLPIIPPQILNFVIPTYPEPALKNGVEGISVVAANIGFDGNVKSIAIKTSSGNIDLDNSAAAAVATWKFAPSTQGGLAVASVFEVPVKFIIGEI